MPGEYQQVLIGTNADQLRRGSTSSISTYPSGYTSTCPSTAASSACSSQILPAPASAASLSRPPTGPASTRGIFIQNLDSRVTWQLLKDKLRPIGEVTRCEVKSEKSVQRGDSKKLKQWGSATFVDRRSAERAVRALDGTEWIGGRRMRVRLDDKASTSAAGIPPKSSSTRRTTSSSSSSKATATTSKTRRTAPEKQNSKPKKDAIKKVKADGGPLVVDGSGRRVKYPSDATDNDSDSSEADSSSASDDSDDGNSSSSSTSLA